MTLARLRAAWSALWADPPTAHLEPAHPIALRDCGPSGPGRPVRDHLPPYLSTEARVLIQVRLAHGERLYGAPLAVGWEPAPVELAQELADAVAYAVAAGLPDGATRDICASLDTALRLTSPSPRG